MSQDGEHVYGWALFIIQMSITLEPQGEQWNAERYSEKVRQDILVCMISLEHMTGTPREPVPGGSSIKTQTNIEEYGEVIMMKVKLKVIQNNM